MRFLDKCVGPEVEYEVNHCAPGTIFMLENLRFHLAEVGSGEDENKKKIKASAEEIQQFRSDLSRCTDVSVGLSVCLSVCLSICFCLLRVFVSL